MNIMETLKDKVEEIIGKIKSDKDIAAKFQKDPISVVEKMLGVDLPNEQLEQVVDAIKAKIDLDKIGGLLGGLFGKK